VSRKKYIYGAIAIGGTIGGYLPVLLFHDNGLSFWSIIGGMIGSFIGIYMVFKLDLGE